MSQVQDIRVQQRVDTKENWEDINPILLENEIGYESDTGKYKIGQQDVHWNDLLYSPKCLNSVEAGVGENAIAIGTEHELLGINSFAAGKGNKVTDKYGMALGRATEAGYAAVAEGMETFAKEYSHAEGRETHAVGKYSHAEGAYTTTNGDRSFAIGQWNTTTQQANDSFVHGIGNSAKFEAQRIGGKYADTTHDCAEIIGYGTSAKDRKNIYVLDWTGNAQFAGKVFTNKDITDDDDDLVLVTKKYLLEQTQALTGLINVMKPTISYTEIFPEHWETDDNGSTWFYDFFDQYNSEIWSVSVGLNGSVATKEQKKAFDDAEIVGCLDNRIKLYGVKPTIPIPIIIQVVNTQWQVS